METLPKRKTKWPRGRILRANPYWIRTVSLSNPLKLPKGVRLWYGRFRWDELRGIRTKSNDPRHRW